ncbi:MAG: D-alanyl-D-alanine carboxypeptidase [Ruminococcaceae bacterium]|nr:D-alanyl-D-alanine carboxypeptidase [Oscillospiraceae bacterium]
MKERRIISLFLALFLMLQLLALPAWATEAETLEEPAEESVEETAEVEEIPEPDVVRPPELVCKGAMLVELNSNTTVYELNADERLYPASLTKIMTCLVALERGNLTDEVEVDGSLFDGMDADASVVGLLPGEKISLEELLYCLMVPSGNDASLVVADHIAGSVEAFVEIMNQKAQELGCNGTHFMNPDGLHDDNHYTTARDMITMTKAALQSETFRTICGTASHEVPETNASSSRMIYTTNYFMSSIITGKYYWDKVSGVKTGFTTPAGRCLVTLVEEDDFSYLSVVLGCETPYDENGEPVYGHFTESRKLLEYGLENFTFVSVLSHLNPIAQVPVSSGKVNSVVIAPAEDLSALLPAEYDPGKIDVSYTLRDGEALQAPLSADEAVGTITVTYDGKEVGKTDARTISAVERNAILATPTKDDPAFLRLVPIVIIVVAFLLLVIAQVNRRKSRKRRKRRR